MNLFQFSSEWLSQVREATCSDTVTINGKSFKATVSFSNSDTNQQGVKLQTQYIHFIIRTETLRFKGITLERGLVIIHKGRKYEIAYDKRLLFEFNDPAGIDTIISTVDRGPV